MRSERATCRANECANGRCNNRCKHAHSLAPTCSLPPRRQEKQDRQIGRLSKSSSRSERGTSSPHSLSHCTVRFPHPSGPPDSPCRPSPFALGKKFASVIPEMLSSLRGRGRPFARVPHPLLPLARPGPGSDGLLKFACPSLLLLSVRPSLPSTQPQNSQNQCRRDRPSARFCT